MIKVKYILLGLAFIMMNTAFAQSSDTTKAKPDTIELSPDHIIPVVIPCPLLSWGDGASDGLLILNSQSDVYSYFGYNCNFPDVDFLSKTLLYLTMNFNKERPYKIRVVGDKVIFSVYICKNDNGKYTISVLIPKVSRDNGVFLDVNEEECKLVPFGAAKQ
jgi:hypothetical protein